MRISGRVRITQPGKVTEKSVRCRISRDWELHKLQLPANLEPCLNRFFATFTQTALEAVRQLSCPEGSYLMPARFALTD